MNVQHHLTQVAPHLLAPTELRMMCEIMFLIAKRRIRCDLSLVDDDHFDSQSATSEVNIIISNGIAKSKCQNFSALTHGWPLVFWCL